MTTEAKVGTFVLASLLILTSTVGYLANAQFRGGKLPYRTYLKYAGGLEAGAPVLFGGIKAGSVTALRPWLSDPTRIEILVESQSRNTGQPEEPGKAWIGERNERTRAVGEHWHQRRRSDRPRPGDPFTGNGHPG